MYVHNKVDNGFKVLKLTWLVKKKKLFIFLNIAKPCELHPSIELCRRGLLQQAGLSPSGRIGKQGLCNS